MSNLIEDGDFLFPHYPLADGRKVSDLPSLVIDAHSNATDYITPWEVTEGFVTVLGRSPNHIYDAAWPEGTNAVFMGSLAGGNPAGTLSQTITRSLTGMGTLRFYARVSIADASGQGACAGAMLDVRVNEKSVGQVWCAPYWRETVLRFSIPSGPEAIKVSFRDVTPQNIRRTECLATLAKVSLTTDTPGYLEKLAGDQQFTWLNLPFKNELRIRLIDNAGRGLANTPVNFDVIRGGATLSAAHLTRVSVVVNNQGEGAMTVFGTATGPSAIQVSTPGVPAVTFDVFVGPNRGEARILSIPSTLVVRQFGSDRMLLRVESRQSGIPLPYFQLTQATLTAPYSFSETELRTQQTPLGTTNADGQLLLPKATIFRHALSADSGLMTLEFDGGKQSVPVIYRH